MAFRIQGGLLVMFGLMTACPDSDKCLWEVDDLLAEADVGPSKRQSCGSFNGAEGERIDDALECLLSTPKGKTAELTVNDCIDCFIESTYVVTADQKLVRVTREADMLGDDTKTVTVTRCVELKRPENQTIECVDDTEVYSCNEPLR